MAPMIFSSIFAEGNSCQAYALHSAEQLPRPIRSTEGIEGGAVMIRDGTGAPEWLYKEDLVTREVRDAAGPESKDRTNVDVLKLLLKSDS
jgi:hypothetical protein